MGFKKIKLFRKWIKRKFSQSHFLPTSWTLTTIFALQNSLRLMESFSIIRQMEFLQMDATVGKKYPSKMRTTLNIFILWGLYLHNTKFDDAPFSFSAVTIGIFSDPIRGIGNWMLFSISSSCRIFTFSHNLSPKMLIFKCHLGVWCIR